MKRYLIVCILVMAVILPPALAGAIPYGTIEITGDTVTNNAGVLTFDVTQVAAGPDAAYQGPYAVSGSTVISLSTLTTTTDLTSPDGFLSGTFASLTSTIDSFGSGTINGIGTDTLNPTISGYFYPNVDYNQVWTFTISGDFYYGGGTYTLDTTPTPEPATVVLLGSGLLGLVGFGRRKFSKKPVA